jgi:hypothetical protein
MYIHIEKNEKIALPKKYRPVNNICAIIYDQLTEIYKRSNYQDFLDHNIKLDSKTQKLVKELRADKIHILDWLKENELNDDLTRLLTKNITLAVASDFLNFFFESISNAKRGKLTIAYALLRKPFMDELLILEQLLVDPHDFIQRFFHSGNPDDYDPSDKNIDKKAIIKKAISKLNANIVFTEDLIYELRYDKSSPNGLNGMVNHALHIVTNDRNYKTQRQNLNLVFSGTEDFVDYWDHYYYFVPYLLIYTVSIIDVIIFNYLPDQANQDLKSVKALRRLIGTIMWTEKTKQNLKKASRKMYKAMGLGIVLHCKKCKHDVKLTKPDFDLFFETETFLCPTCMRNLLTTHESIKPIKIFMDNLK